MKITYSFPIHYLHFGYRRQYDSLAVFFSPISCPPKPLLKRIIIYEIQKSSKHFKELYYAGSKTVDNI